MHSRRRSNVFGDAEFWFLPKLYQILLKFAQILPKFGQIGLNYFAQICLKNLLVDAAASPASPAPYMPLFIRYSILRFDFTKSQN